MPEETTTEKIIIDAARDVFYAKGFDGARMHDIAREAGINQALLHYYFRSKDKLFEAVFREAVVRTFPLFFSILESDMPLEEKIPHFVETYIDHLLANPYLPGFIMHELSRNPNRVRDMVGSSVGRRPTKILEQYETGVREGRFVPMDPRQFVVSMMGLCVIPFMARPIIQMLLGIDDQSYPVFLNERKTMVTQFILKAIKTS